MGWTCSLDLEGNECVQNFGGRRSSETSAWTTEEMGPQY
jgi:hypothetical protein